MMSCQHRRCYFSSSIGKKQILGVTGLLLCGFLFTHLLGNLSIICSLEAFNRYAHALITNPLILYAEIGLGLLFITHIVLAIKLTLENKAARPEPYHFKVRTGRGATFASSTMPYTGVFILVFLILHMIHFRFGPHYSITYDGVEMRDLSKLIMETFSSPLMVIYYVIAVIATGIHVSHGFASAFQSLGLGHPRYIKMLKKLSCLYAVLITIGFSAIPIWAFIKQGVQL